VSLRELIIQTLGWMGFFVILAAWFFIDA